MLLCLLLTLAMTLAVNTLPGRGLYNVVDDVNTGNFFVFDVAAQSDLFITLEVDATIGTAVFEGYVFNVQNAASNTTIQ